MSSEVENSDAIRAAASRFGSRLWRNNVGAMYDENRRLVRYGLANESKQMSSVVKSGDLIGITPVLILPGHVGMTLGIFTSIEVKKTGWVYKGTGREPAQKNWNELIINLGGIGMFATSPIEAGYL